MIDPPTQPPERPERKIELDQTVDFALPLFVEEAHTVGWQRVEFLTAVVDAANSRLSALEEERDSDVAVVEELANDWPAAPTDQSSTS